MLSSARLPSYRRPQFSQLSGRLAEPRQFIQVVAGPRQVGKTTLVRQVLAEFGGPSRYATADDPGLPDRSWLEAEWQAARVLARAAGRVAVLVLDEAQKIPSWSEVVKRLWDEDTFAGLDLRVVLLGSAPLLVQRGLTESLAGRFEVIRLSHWGFAEMRTAFGWDIERFVLFGGYPGAARLTDEWERWRAYILDSLVETALSRDILLLQRIEKPALLRQLFRLGCDYSGQVVSYQKLVGQLTDAGNTTTIAHYLRLLADAGLLKGLEKYSGSKVRQRGSSPKLLALNTGLMTAMSGRSPEDARQDADFWGRLVETAVGAHLANTLSGRIELTWWRERSHEVDYVLSSPPTLRAIEVASGRRKPQLPGLREFVKAHPQASPLLVGAQGLPLETALSVPAEDLL
jgi:hypothetical protein